MIVLELSCFGEFGDTLAFPKSSHLQPKYSLFPDGATILTLAKVWAADWETHEKPSPVVRIAQQRNQWRQTNSHARGALLHVVVFDFWARGCLEILQCALCAEKMNSECHFDVGYHKVTDKRQICNLRQQVVTVMIGMMSDTNIRLLTEKLHVLLCGKSKTQRAEID